MPIPKYDEMYLAFLTSLADGEPHHIKEIRDTMASDFQLTAEEQTELIPSGKQTLFYNRAAWASTYLRKAKLIERSSRGVFCLTETGKQVLSEHPASIDNQFLRRFDSFREFMDSSTPSSSSKSKTTPSQATVPLRNETPQDTLLEAYNQIHSALVDDLLDEIMKQPPVFFEQLVVELLVKMGYGGSLENAGTVTKQSGDEGIDGIIREDKLGFNLIYIQAKRWDLDKAIGRPEIQKFVGALAGQGAAKGLFITTAQFTKEARTYANQQHTTKIVLVDGTTLATLMIEHDLGVSTETTYKIKRIDTDFFPELSE